MIKRLEARVAELERQLGRTSENSSQPPSSDPPGASKPKPAEKKAGGKRKPGGQPGHRGKTRELLPPEKVDHVEDHWPDDCGQCGRRLPARSRRDARPPMRHQVTELPPVSPETTEYRCHSQACPGCGGVTTANLSEGTPRGAFGPRLVALVGILSGCYRLSKRSVVGVLKDIFDVDMALGSVSACEQSVSATLAQPYAEACEYVQGQAIAHADETSWREGRQRAWLWVAATSAVTVFSICQRRSQAAAKKLLGVFRGILVSDRYDAYGWYDGLRQVCWAHLKRDFKAMSEYAGIAGWIGSALSKQRREIFRLWNRIRDGTLSRQEFQRNMRPIRLRVEHLLLLGKRIAPPIAGRCQEMLKRFDAFFTFVDHEGVEPTNNLAEQQLRFAVIWRKTSFGTHSPDGSRFVERMLTIRGSLRQQERSVVEYIVEAQRAALHHERTPSILPPAAAAAAIPA